MLSVFQKILFPFYYGEVRLNTNIWGSLTGNHPWPHCSPDHGLHSLPPIYVIGSVIENTWDHPFYTCLICSSMQSSMHIEDPILKRPVHTSPWIRIEFNLMWCAFERSHGMHIRLTSCQTTSRGGFNPIWPFEPGLGVCMWPHTRAHDILPQKVEEQLCRNKRRRLDHKRTAKEHNLQCECKRGIHANDLAVFDGDCVCCCMQETRSIGERL